MHTDARAGLSCCIQRGACSTALQQHARARRWAQAERGERGPPNHAAKPARQQPHCVPSRACAQ
eukprot:5730436-Pleurochrysis_carterae.AAC.2